MIRAILIDDEPPALRALEMALKKQGGVQVEGMFTDAREGIRRVGAVLPEAVFLDIDMPQLNGMDAASEILDKSPFTDVVFVTAHDEYALQAFEVHALDYLLKPVSAARLAATLERLKTRQLRTGAPALAAVPSIRCFGGFELKMDGVVVKWRSEKTKELFAFLLHHARRPVSKYEMLDALWRDEAPDRASKLLYNGVYYIRKTLADYGINQNMLHVDSSYTLHMGQTEHDVTRFCALFERKENRLEALKQMESLYEGGYFGALAYDWAEYEHEKLLGLYLRCAKELAGLYAKDNRHFEAETVLKRAYAQDSFSEDVNENLLALYRNTGNRAAARKHYEAYRLLLKKELNLRPSARIAELMRWTEQ